MPTYSQLNSSMQSQAGSQLRTFDKTILLSVNTYRRATQGQWSSTGTHYSYHRFEYVNAAYSLYNNYLDSGIYTGGIIRSADVTDSITSLVRRTVDLIEGRISDRTVNAYLCHNSCHQSCHGSRGRR